MGPEYDLTEEAHQDLFDIWRRIAEDSVDLADRIEGEFHKQFVSLAQMPGLGHTRKDLTMRPFLFFHYIRF